MANFTLSEAYKIRRCVTQRSRMQCTWPGFCTWDGGSCSYVSPQVNLTTTESPPPDSPADGVHVASGNLFWFLVGFGAGIAVLVLAVSVCCWWYLCRPLGGTPVFPRKGTDEEIPLEPRKKGEEKKL